jgi:hypothetical protein
LSSKIFTREAPVAARWGILAIVVLALGISQCQMAAQASAPLVFLPDKLPWVSPPNNPRLRFAWILGNEQNTGAYLLRATAGFCLVVLRFGIGAVRGGEEKEAGFPYFFLVVAP